MRARAVSLQASGRQRQGKAETGGERRECGQIREATSLSQIWPMAGQRAAGSGSMPEKGVEKSV